MDAHDQKLAESALQDAGHDTQTMPDGSIRVLLGRRSHRTFDTLQHVLDWLQERDWRD